MLMSPLSDRSSTRTLSVSLSACGENGIKFVFIPSIIVFRGAIPFFNISAFETNAIHPEKIKIDKSMLIAVGV
jgi:hypothetical protein